MQHKKIRGATRYTIYEDGTIFDDKNNRYISQVITGIPEYKYVNLWMDNGNRKLKRVHRLLAEAFIPNPEHHPLVDHINRDRLDNSLSNLRWVTRKENSRNRIDSWYIYIGGKKVHLTDLSQELSAIGVHPTSTERDFLRASLISGNNYTSLEGITLILKEYRIKKDKIKRQKELRSNKHFKDLDNLLHKIWFGVCGYNSRRERYYDLCSKTDGKVLTYASWVQRGTGDDVSFLGKPKPQDIVFLHQFHEDNNVPWSFDITKSRYYKFKRRGKEFTKKDLLKPPRVRRYRYKGEIYSLSTLCSLLGYNINTLSKKINYSNTLDKYIKKLGDSRWVFIEPIIT